MARVIVAVSFLLLAGAYAQDPTVPLTAGDLPLPDHWKSNAMVVLAINFALGMIALGVRKIPGKVGSIIQKLIDVLSANVAHKDKK